MTSGVKGWSRDPQQYAFALDLWAKGHSVNEIARRCSAAWRIDITKNAIVGVAHRNTKDWTPRKSPIIRDYTSPPRIAVARACPPPGGYLPALPSTLMPIPITRLAAAPAVLPPKPRPEPALPPPEPAPPKVALRDPAAPLRRSDETGCLTVLEKKYEAGRAIWVTCDRPLYSINKPYCIDCADKHYIKTRRREDADADSS